MMLTHGKNQILNVKAETVAWLAGECEIRRQSSSGCHDIRRFVTGTLILGVRSGLVKDRRDDTRSLQFGERNGQHMLGTSRTLTPFSYLHNRPRLAAQGSEDTQEDTVVFVLQSYQHRQCVAVAGRHYLQQLKWIEDCKRGTETS